MKLFMKVFRNLQTRIFGKKSMRIRKPVGPSARPKNGLLILGVLLTVLIMVALTVFNLRLIREQTSANKQPAKNSIPENFVTVIPERIITDSKPEEKSRQAAPEVTFYKQLKSEDDRKSTHDNSSPKNRSADSENKITTKEGGRQSSKLAKDETGFSAPASSGIPHSVDSETKADFSRVNHGSKLYSVQVGVFSHPRIAQEWAEKWRSRGYPVALRPIARPNSGVQYRLFLGEFNSEKKAEEFVKQLKVKEGVTGLTLLIKD